MKKLFIIALAICAIDSTMLGQSGFQYRRTAIHNANQVRTVFGNWGVIGQPANQGRRGAWKFDNNGYLGDVSLLVGADVKYLDGRDNLTREFKSVVDCPVDRPQKMPRDEAPDGTQWTFEPVAGYYGTAIPTSEQTIAMSDKKSSWPASWPDKMNDANDPGWAGTWNGYFGKKTSADQESYFVMDDNDDRRFNFANNNTGNIQFKPNSQDSSRNGMGLVVRVRGMQWQFPAQDNIFWLYEIQNTGTTTYDRAVFGMLVGTFVGVTSTESSSEPLDDWSFYDVNTNITYTGDFDRNATSNPLWRGPVGMVGYAFLESPGNPFDGIDNDADADSATAAQMSPKFRDASFDSTLLTAGMQIVLINDDFSRSLYTIPNDTLLTVYTRGATVVIRPGKTKVNEGNVISDAQGNPIINPNAYDGIDNDFDGLIDENYYLHNHQIKRDRTPPYKILIDINRPQRYIDYVTNAGNSPYSMIDEKRNDRIDNDRDWDVAFDDVGRDGVAGTKDFGEKDGVPTSGYDDLGKDTGLPGEPNIDKTDVHESDQIGLTSFWYFVPSNNVSFGDDAALWSSLAPGFFDVPASIENNRPTRGEDGDFIYGSGYFPLLAGTTERFSLALVYGGGKGGTREDDIADLLKNKKAVQKIYDGNYQFQQPPDAPTVTAVPGDKQVTLYWDRKAELSVDPVQRVKDFEGYKIYRSTDPDFSDILKITDADGAAKGYLPLAQFDMRDGITGYFQPTPAYFQDLQGRSYYMGSDNGLVHTYVDRDLDNGRRYYYAVVAYDRGDEALDIFPSENKKKITISTSGVIETDQNVVVVAPGKPVAGYEGPNTDISLTPISQVGTGTISYRVVDDTKVTGHSYRLTFFDSLTDSVDNNNNKVMDAADTTEWSRITSYYSVLDLNEMKETFSLSDTGVARLNHRNLIKSTIVIITSSGVNVPSGAYSVDSALGIIRPLDRTAMPKGNYSITFKYYPVFKSPYIKGNPYEAETQDADVFDGIQLVFTNAWVLDTIKLDHNWTGPIADTANYVYNFSMVSRPSFGLNGYKRPADYEIQFSPTIIDTSLAVPSLGVPAIPIYFRIYNKTEKRYVQFIYGDYEWQKGRLDLPGYGRISPRDELYFQEPSPLGGLVSTWGLYFSVKAGELDTVYYYGTQDRLTLNIHKPFNEWDVYEFSTKVPTVNKSTAEVKLLNVRVVPNPYVTANALEPPLPPGITSGRGQRRIDFINLPPSAKIHIYTSRGDHVITLEHSGNIYDGTVSWNLKTKENLDVAFGVYFYVVESSVGNKTGKLAIIK
jgi:hypothetical protein